MRCARLTLCAALAALVIVSDATPLTAQQRERRSRKPDRDALPQATQPAATQPAPARTRSSRHTYDDRYAVLEHRNIFVKDRSRAATRPGGSSGSTQPARRTAEESLVLRGIAMEEIGYRAYLEDLNDLATLKVSPGDKLALGRVTLIALDAIAYEHDGVQKWIEIGSDLMGKVSAVVAPTTSVAPGDTSSTGPTSLPANLDPNDPSLTVEQRMRIRRLQQQRR